MIPMSIEEQVAQLEPDKSQPKEAEQLHIVDDNVEPGTAGGTGG